MIEVFPLVELDTVLDTENVLISFQMANLGNFIAFFRLLNEKHSTKNILLVCGLLLFVRSKKNSAFLWHPKVQSLFSSYPFYLSPVPSLLSLSFGRYRLRLVHSSAEQTIN